MFKFISLFFISLFLISCNEITSPILESNTHNPNNNGVNVTTNTDFVQVGKTYLAMEESLWNVRDGRYSFKKATIFGEIKDTVNSVPYNITPYKDTFFRITDRDSFGRHYLLSSTNGINIIRREPITFDTFQGYTPSIIQGKYFTNDGFLYLITFINRNDLKESDRGLYSTFFIYKNTSSYNFTDFKLINYHNIRGAIDGWHNLIYNEDTKKYYIYGRKRGELDWGPFQSSNEFLREAIPDRRGVRILEANDIEGTWTEINPIDPINFQPQYTNPNYDIRMDYYGGAATYYFGNVLMQISTFFKDKNRVPSTRPERISGTGSVYPTLWHSSDGVEFKPTHPTMTRSLVPLFLHERDWSIYYRETLGYFEVGQIYSTSLVVKDTLVYMFYMNRWDTHYLRHPQQPRSQYWASYIILDRFSSYQPLNVTCTGIYFGKQSATQNTKCAPATITTKVLETPEGSTAVGINVDGNFTLRIFNENMELIDEVSDITTNQVSYIFKPEYGDLPRKAIIQIELYSGDFYALKFFK